MHKRGFFLAGVDEALGIDLLNLKRYFVKSNCFDCESNTGPSDLQSDALPTELSKLMRAR